MTPPGRFYYPMGRPTPQASQEAAVAQVATVFREEGGQINRENMEPLMRACQLPLYWKAPLFIAAGGDKLGYLTQEQFTDYWSRWGAAFIYVLFMHICVHVCKNVCMLLSEYHSVQHLQMINP